MDPAPPLPLPCPLQAGWELVRTIELPRTLADGSDRRNPLGKAVSVSATRTMSRSTARETCGSSPTVR